MDSDVESGLVVMLFGVAGIVIAGLEHALYTRGVLIDDFIINSVTIADLMTLTIIVWLLLGMIVAIMKR